MMEKLHLDVFFTVRKIGYFLWVVSKIADCQFVRLLTHNRYETPVMCTIVNLAIFNALFL